jgi:isopenicillin N synthase-like dioxygenase
LTLLYQDQLGGLEVFNHQKTEWITVVPEQDAVLLNTGDILEILTSGQIPATL